MKLKVLEQNKDTLKVEFDGVDPSVVGAIRRTIINRVPVLAIEDIDILVNSSALYDEVIAHRLGMIPFVFDVKKLVQKNVCSCKGAGCDKCEVTMVLNKVGPCKVYAKDIKIANSSVKTVDGNVLLISLLDKQRLHFEMRAELNIAKEHAKWQPAIVGYSYDADAKGSDKNKVVFNLKSISGLNPKQIILKSVEIMKQRLDVFEEALKNPGKNIPEPGDETVEKKVVIKAVKKEVSDTEEVKEEVKEKKKVSTEEAGVA